MEQNHATRSEPVEKPPQVPSLSPVSSVGHMSCDSQSCSPVIQFVGEGHLKTLAVGRPKKSLSNETGTIGDHKKFNFKKSPTLGASKVTASVTSSLDFVHERVSNIPTSSTSRTQTSRAPAHKSNFTSHSGQNNVYPLPVTSNTLFVVGKDSQDSDLDLSLDSEALFPLGTSDHKKSNNSPVNRNLSPTIDLPKATNTLHVTPATTESSVRSPNICGRDTTKDLPTPINSPNTTGADPANPIFKTPHIGLCFSRLRQRSSAHIPSMSPLSRPEGDYQNLAAGSPSHTEWDTPQPYVSPAVSVSSVSRSGKRKRKFPGPAGLLPQLVGVQTY